MSQLHDDRDDMLFLWFALLVLIFVVIPALYAAHKGSVNAPLVWLASIQLRVFAPFSEEARTILERLTEVEPAALTWEQVMAAEKAANEVIWQDTPVDITFPAPDALARLNYRSKKALTGQVRIVAFPGADCCACCGTHVRRAGEVGIIKILSCQKFREGVRLEILCGSRAYRYLSQVYDQDRAVAQLLSVKPQDTLAAAERQAEELAAAKQRMTELEDQLFSLRAQALTDRGDLLLLEPPTRPDGARKLAAAAATASGGLAAVFAGAESSYVYALVQADRADISPLVKRLNAALSGRGGGRNGFAQGSVQADRTAICDFFRKEGIECPTC